MKNNPTLLAIMRTGTLQLFFLLMVMGTCLANNTSAQAVLRKKASLTGTTQSVSNHLKTMEKAYGVTFVYSPELIRADQSAVLVSVKEYTLSEALQELLGPLQITYEVFGKNIVLNRASKPAHAISTQQRTVRGRVTDTNNQPLAGVSIHEVGVQGGTTSNEQGEFSITIQGDNAVLRFSYVGYSPREIPVQDSYLTVVLTEAFADLQEVVVVGYSMQRKENITGSVATVSGDDLTDVASPNISNLLQGKVAGLDVSAGTGQPGQLPTIRIRGVSSIRSSRDPIWVVDGVIQHDTPRLNPQDVESISVLKDASSAALYGSRGANGVIVVTTRRAKEDGQTTITFSSKTGATAFNTGGFELMTGPELYDFWSTFGNQSGIPDWYTPDLLNTDTDWQHLGTQTGLIQDYNLSINGNSGKTSLFSALNYFKEDGSVKGMSFERYAGRLNLDYKVTEKFTLQPKLAVTYSKTRDQQHSLYGIYTNLPWDNPYDEAGNPVNAQAPGSGWRGRDLSNYLYDLQWNYTNNNVFNTMVNLDASYQLLPYLTFKTTNNLTYYVADGMEYVDPRSIAGLADQGRLQNSNAYRTTRFTNQMLTFNKAYDDHTIDALVAYEYNDYMYKNNTGTGKGIVPGITIPSGASGPLSVSGTTNDYAFQSVLMNVNYSYTDRYVLQGSFRRDGSSRFGSNSKYGNFFSVSGAWNIHNELFFESKAIDFLRLKAAYGGVGNTPETLYPQYELFSVNAQYNGDPTAFPSELGNKDLTWEKTYSTNIGLETSFFGRAQLMLEVYNRQTSGLLHYVPLPYISGYNGYWDNIGSVRNRGLEVTLDADIIRSEAFQWNLGLNVGVNRNKITELYGGARQINGNQVYEEGYDINTWFLRKWAGVNPENGTPQWEAVNASTGEATITGNYAAATLQHVGTATPDYFGGLNTSLKYGNLHLSANFAFTQGIMVYNGGRELFDSDGAYATYNQMRLKGDWTRWSPETPNATHPQAFYGGNNRSNGVSSRYLEDGSYIRLRNVNLGYQFRGSWLERLRIKSLNASVSIDNLFTITDYSGLDPEAAAMGSTSSPYPLPRRTMFGLDIQF